MSRARSSQGRRWPVIPQTVYDEIGVYEKEQLDAMAKLVDIPAGRVTTTVRIGGVYPELLAEAEDWQADLIVVGAHRRSMATFLLGSTAAALSRHAKCTVMIVRSPLKADDSPAQVEFKPMTSYSLKKITLHAARSKGFPDGSIRHGYSFTAPLTPDGHIDLAGWKAHRGECFARRFWGDEPEERGLLMHRAGGHGGGTWGFEMGVSAKLDEEEAGFRFGDHAFREGEYVSVREPDGELVTFKVASVA